MIGIYKITNSINHKCYIGQSINIESRWQEHQRNSANPNSPKYHYPLYCAFRKYGVDKFDFEILEECSEEGLNQAEIKWISYYDSFENGYNLSRGGGGLRQYDVNGIVESYKITNNIHETARIFGCHPTTVRNIVHSAGLKGEEASERAIEQIDPKTMNVIAQYRSIFSASIATGLTSAAITKALSGEHSNAGGYYWRDKGDTTRKFQPVKLWRKGVIQLDRETKEEIARYKSAADAARALNKDPKNGGSQISRVCRGVKPTAFNYIWRFIEA